MTEGFGLPLRSFSSSDIEPLAEGFTGGVVVGFKVGFALGAAVGFRVGAGLGLTEGFVVGGVEGLMLGCATGLGEPLSNSSRVLPLDGVTMIGADASGPGL